jgi:two-component system cell cycle sensor histidine kinase/response regulator CckA
MDAHHASAAARKILVIEEHEPARTQLCHILRLAGYTAIPARSGVEAQWYAGEPGHAVDLVLTDLMLPEADGYHFGIPFGLLQQHVPVVFMSTTPRDETIRRGLLHPRMPYLRKPFPPHVLTRTVQRALSRWSMPPQA